jgi:glutamyl-tRNA reductase
VIVANRTLPHAEHLAGQLDAETSAVGLEAVGVAVDEADVVVSATGSSGYVIDDADLETTGETCVIDIAQPRDVDPSADGGDVSVYDLDAIESITDETRSKRRAAAEIVESMIDEELDHLLAQYKRKRADRVIAAMYEGAERIKARELQTAVSKLEAAEGDLGEEEREILESMADALVGQLLSAPTRSLREAAEKDDWSTISTALRLFGPGLEPEPSAPAVPDGPAEADVPEEMRERMPARVIEQLEDE